MVSACLCEFCQVDLISIEAIKDGIKVDSLFRINF